MKKITAIPFFACIALVVLGAITFSTLEKSKNADDRAFSEGLSERQKWEWMRYHDPATGKIPRNARAHELEYATTLPKRYRTKNDQTLSQQWNSRGPWNVGGRTRALAYDVRNEKIILAGGVSGGIWRSTDGGNTWTKTLSKRQLQSITTIAQDTREGKEDVWYAGTGEIWGNSAEISGDGILKSTDNGVTWQFLSQTVSGTPGSWDKQYDYIWRVVTDPSNFNTDVVLASYALGGISRSTDGGATWTNVLGTFGNNSSVFSEIERSPSGIFYAALSSYGTNQNNPSSYGGIYRSTDGIRWTKITPDDFPKKYGRIAIGISPSDENTVYFLAHTPGVGKRYVSRRGEEDWNSLFKYRYIAGDGAGVQGKWDNLSENVPDLGGDFGIYNAQGSYNMYVRVHPENSNIVFLGGTNIYRSEDGCSSQKYTWCGGYLPNSSLPEYGVYPNHHPDCHDFVFLKSDNKKALSATDGGVTLSENVLADNVQWKSLNSGYLTTQFYTLAVEETAGSQKIMGGLQDNGTLIVNSADPKSEWAAPGLGDGSYCYFGKNNRVYMSRQLGRMEHYELDDNGNVLKKGRFDPVGGKGYLFINPFILDPNEKSRVYLAGGKILWRNNNVLDIGFGQKDSVTTNWDSLQATRITGASNHLISALAMGKSSKILYYGTTQGKIYKLEDATEGQPVPKELKGGFPTAYVSSITVDNDDEKHVLICFSNYGVQSIYVTYDAGNTWASVGGNLDKDEKGTINAPSVKWVEMMNVQGTKRYFAGTSVGLFSTGFLNGNRTVWVQEGADEIGNVPVDMIKVRQSDNSVFIATHGAGVYSSQVTTGYELPTQIQLSSPTDGSRGFLEFALLKWLVSEKSHYYELQIANDSDFNTVVFNSDALDKTEYQYYDLVSGLKTMYWRVRGLNEGGAGPWSATWKFVTAVQEPELQLPENNAQSVIRNPLLVWKSVEGSTKYHVQLSTSSTFSPVEIEDSMLNVLQYQTWTLSSDKQYFWRVRAGNSDGWGNFSNRFRFKTGTTVDIQENIQKKNRLYPNPVNSILTLDMSKVQNGNSTIEIYSSSGILMKKISGSAGSMMRIDVSDFAIGSYYLYVKDHNGTICYREEFVKQ